MRKIGGEKDKGAGKSITASVCAVDLFVEVTITSDTPIFEATSTLPRARIRCTFQQTKQISDTCVAVRLIPCRMPYRIVDPVNDFFPALRFRK